MPRYERSIVHEAPSPASVAEAIDSSLILNCACLLAQFEGVCSQVCQESLPIMSHCCWEKVLRSRASVHARAGCYRDGGAAALPGCMAESRCLRRKPLVDQADRWQASISNVREVLRHAASWPGRLARGWAPSSKNTPVAIFRCPCHRARHRETHL